MSSGTVTSYCDSSRINVKVSSMFEEIFRCFVAVIDACGIGERWGRPITVKIIRVKISLRLETVQLAL